MNSDNQALRAADRLAKTLQTEEQATRARQTAQALRETAESKAMPITPDGRIGEADLAKLLSLAAGTLANRRREGRAPPHYTIAIAGHRVTYRIEEVAEWIEKNRQTA